MAIDPTIPNDNMKPPPSSGSPTIPAAPGVQQLNTANAKARLKQKNRKKNEMVILLPGLRLDCESATTGKLTGFTPDADNEIWVLGIVELKASGKEGSETSLTLYPVQKY